MGWQRAQKKLSGFKVLFHFFLEDVTHFEGIYVYEGAFAYDDGFEVLFGNYFCEGAEVWAIGFFVEGVVPFFAFCGVFDFCEVTVKVLDCLCA